MKGKRGFIRAYPGLALVAVVLILAAMIFGPGVADDHDTTTWQVVTESAQLAEAPPVNRNEELTRQIVGGDWKIERMSTGQNGLHNVVASSLNTQARIALSGRGVLFTYGVVGDHFTVTLDDTGFSEDLGIRLRTGEVINLRCPWRFELRTY